MALKKCKECGEKISKKAESCPKCGSPQKRKTLGCGSLILILIILGTVGSIVSNFSTTDNKTGGKTVVKKDWREQDNSTMAYIMIEDFVKERLKSPKSADFPGVFDGRADHVTYLGNQKYRITSYVDAQNSFGASIRNKFTGEIEQTSENQWRLLSLEIF